MKCRNGMTRIRSRGSLRRLREGEGAGAEAEAEAVAEADAEAVADADAAADVRLCNDCRLLGCKVCKNLENLMGDRERLFRIRRLHGAVAPMDDTVALLITGGQVIPERFSAQ